MKRGEGWVLSEEASPRLSSGFRIIAGGGVDASIDELRRKDAELLSGAVLFDLDGGRRFRFLSAAAWRLIGLDARVTEGRTFDELFLTIESGVDRALVAQAMAARRPFVNCRVRASYDPSRLLRVSGKPIVDAATGVAGWRCVASTLDAADAANANSTSAHRTLGLMSEALLRQAQDYIMAADGALELAVDVGPPNEAITLARDALSQCLQMQAAFVGFCRSHLLENDLCLVTPVLSGAARAAALALGRAPSEVIVLQHDDLLAFADEAALYESVYAWMAALPQNRFGRAGAMLVFASVGVANDEDKRQCLSINVVINEDPQPGGAGLCGDHAELPTSFSAFSVREAIQSMR